MTTTNSLIADLEAGLAAARRLAEGDTAQPSQPVEPEPEPNMMPGGVDSAPVSAVETAVADGVGELKTEIKPIEHAAETEGLDLLHEFREGKAVKEVAHLVSEAPNALESIVKAIGDIAQGVRI